MKKIAGVTAPLLAAAAFGVLALPALAEDFEFEVPVELAKIDANFPQGRVDCSVWGPGGANGVDRFGRVLYAGGSAPFTLTNGGFKGSVSVKFNVDRTLHNPASAHSWTCMLTLLSLSASHPLCLIDAATGQTTGRVPAGVNVDSKSLKACVNGTLASPGK